MKILVTGANGQVGWELARSLLPLGDVVALSREQFDLADLNGLRTEINTIKPDIIVNAAAYTAVDKAEQETELAYLINAEAVAVMAEEIKKRQGLLIHYSTDYVFDGALDKPYQESDVPCPINAYGKSKLAGETAIQDSGVDYLIFRTSWVYAARAHNFLKSILRLAQERENLSIVSDQIGTPTWARLIAEVTSYALRQAIQERHEGVYSSGLYHLTSAGSTSWYGFANAIIDIANQQTGMIIKTHKIKPIPTTEYPLPAPRPHNSRMDVAMLEQKFGLKMPDWHEALAFCMQDL